MLLRISEGDYHTPQDQDPEQKQDLPNQEAVPARPDRPVREQSRESTHHPSNVRVAGVPDRTRLRLPGHGAGGRDH